METNIIGYTGTAIRIHSFIPSYQRPAWGFGLEDLSLKAPGLQFWVQG